MTTEVRSSFCRACSALCAIEVTVVDGVATKVIGDVRDPVYAGYSCKKGRHLPEQHRSPNRVVRSLRRRSGGNRDEGFEEVPTLQAIDEVAERLGAIIAEHGPRSVAVYQGTHGMAQPVAAAMSDLLMRAIGSPMIFNPLTIDQPGKILAAGMHGRWNGGTWHLHEADVWLFIGTNPLVSMWGGTFVYNPARQFREARRRGVKIIVIDPRVTETARFADLHLQPQPGHDAILLAGIVRTVLASGRFDRAFCDRWSEGLDALSRAVEPFSDDVVMARTGIGSAQISAVAEALVSSRRGVALAGTGTNMAPDGVLAEYLLTCLYTICGYFKRAGDPVPNPGTLLPPRTFEERALAPRQNWDVGEALASTQMRGITGSMPTGQLADEICHDGPDRIRALINWAGNPLLAVPDQLKMIEALDRLDLLVSIDPHMTATSRRSHYVIAPKLSFEMPSVTWFHERSEAYLYPTCNAYPAPYVHYTPTIVEPPEDSDVIDDWVFFHRIAGRLGHTLSIGGVPVDPEAPPTSEELLAQFFNGSTVPFEEIASSDRGRIMDLPPVEVTAPRPGRDLSPRLQLAHPLMIERLSALAAERPGPVDGRLRLISRREAHVYNSTGIDAVSLVGDRPFNPAHMNPDDMTARGLVDGSLVEISSARASIVAVVEAEATLVSGAVSMAHCWGDGPERDGEVRSIGSPTGRLIDSLVGMDPMCGIPVMSAIEVTVRHLEPLAHAEG